jgi:hypothetical protein
MVMHCYITVFFYTVTAKKIEGISKKGNPFFMLYIIYG